MKSVVSLVLCVCVWSGIVAQDWAKVTAPSKDESLKVGDRLPFEVLHNMMNYPKKEMRLPDHRPKLMLFDFWGVQCAPCIAAWPKLLEFQKEFGKDLQIVLIDKYENEKQVKDFTARRKRIYNVDMNLPISSRDTTIWKYFPAMDVPRYYWIDSNHVIRGITRGDELTRENIKKWIDSGPLDLKEIEYIKWQSIDPLEPIFVNGNGGERSSDVFLWSSSLTKGQSDNGAAALINFDSRFGYGLTVVNHGIIHLYGIAYNNRLGQSHVIDFLPTARMELHAKDSSRFYSKYTRGGASYNYQLIPPTPKSREELVAMMKEDLSRYFKMDVRWEKRKKKCLVFSMYDSTLAKQKMLGFDISIKDMGIALDSVPMWVVIEQLELGTPYKFSRFPLVDETGYKGLLTGIRAEGNAYDWVEFDKMISRFGMHLKVEMREVEILVLREPKSTP